MNCDVIKDIIPLYSENLCSAESAAMIEEHLQTCEDCRKLLENPPADTAEADIAGENDAKPFKKVNRRIKMRTGFIVLLIILLIAILAPITYLTYCQIFKPEGGVSFDTLIIEAQARPIAKFIAEGRADKYVDSISALAFALNANISGNEDYIQSVKNKISECYEPVKKYSPKVMSVNAGFFGESEDYSVTARIKFTISRDKWIFYDFCLMRHYDGKFIATNAISDSDFFERQLNDTEAAEAISNYINSILKASVFSYTNAANSIERYLSEGSAQTKRGRAEWIADHVSSYFVPENKKNVYTGVNSYLSYGYPVYAYFSDLYFDSEKQMQYYLVTLSNGQSGSANVITIRLYADERGFYSPLRSDIWGDNAPYSDAKNMLVSVFGLRTA